MKLKLFSSKNDVFVNFECGIAFKYAATWDKYALLPVICADFGLSRASCVHFDRIGYLSLHNLTD